MPFRVEILCLACAVATWLLAHGWRIIAPRIRFIAHPNERSAATHIAPTPTSGGIAFLAVFSAALLWLWSTGLVPANTLFACFGPIFVGCVGFIDDLKPLPVQIRTPAYFLASAWTIAWIGFPILNIGGTLIDIGILGYLFGMIALVWLQNLYNFMDGIDGLATSEAIFVLVAVWLIGGGVPWAGWDSVIILLAASSLGFLVINWPTARVFMGDVGSGFLGLLLGALSLAYAPVSVWTWMILLAYFLTDACLTICIRLVRGEKIYESHNLHAYQHLTRRYGGTPVLSGVLLVNAVWLLPLAFLSHSYPDMAAFLLILAAVPLLLLEFLCGAGQEQPRLSLVKS